MANNPTGDQYPPKGTFAASSPVSETEVREKYEAIKAILRQIITDLPRKRDWLDPAVEKVARSFVNEAASVLTEEQPGDGASVIDGNDEFLIGAAGKLARQVFQNKRDIDAAKIVAKASHPQDEREQAFTEIMGAIDMPSDGSPLYDQWLFDKAWDAALASRIRK